MNNAEKFSKACDAIEAGGSEEQFCEALEGMSDDLLQSILAVTLMLLVETGRATDEQKAILGQLQATMDAEQLSRFVTMWKVSSEQANSADENRNRMIAMSDEWLNEDPEPEQAA